MSDVKVNGNAYNGVGSIRLMKVDGSGYATYTEGIAEADPMIGKLIAAGNLGNIEEEVGNVYLSWMAGLKFGTVSFPYATKATGFPHSCTFENLLLPSVVDFGGAVGSGKDGYRLPNGIQNCIITGSLDLSKVATSLNSALNITNCRIGTLKLGSYMPGWGPTNIITNALIPCFTTEYGISYFKSMTITNLYVPTDVVEHVRSLMTNGSLPNITNVYSIDEWED